MDSIGKVLLINNYLVYNLYSYYTHKKIGRRKKSLIHGFYITFFTELNDTVSFSSLAYLNRLFQ